MLITEILDQRLVVAENNKDSLPTIAIINGPTGHGKTPIVHEWLNEKGLNYSFIDVPSLTKTGIEVEVDDYESLFKGQTVAALPRTGIPKKKIIIHTIFSANEIDKMDQDRHVIVLDNYDWGRYTIRKQVLKLIRQSKVRDIREVDNQYVKHLSKLLLLIIVVHPDFENGMDEYDEIEEQYFGKHLHF